MPGVMPERGCSGQGPYLREGGTGAGQHVTSGNEEGLQLDTLSDMWLLLRPVPLKEGSDLERMFSNALRGTSEVYP